MNVMHGDFTRAYIGRRSSEGWSKAGLAGGSGMAGTVCLKDFVRSKGIEEVAILHCDIQGYEYEMLRGCGDMIRQRKIGFLFISTHSLKVHFQCRNHLARRGYSFLAEHIPKESYSDDGLLVACALPGDMPRIELSKKPISLRQRTKAVFFRATMRRC
jgi:hypothetical protein